VSTSLRLDCSTEKDIPEVSDIIQMATREQHLVLRLPRGTRNKAPRVSKHLIIANLATQLPEHSVFDSGGDRSTEWITILKHVDRQVVLAQAEYLGAAARQFRTLAHDLVDRLAEKLNLPIDAFTDKLIRAQLSEEQQSGALPGGWRFEFHGFECAFVNESTGQAVDVLLGFPNEFGVLDPYFFYRFLETTPTLKSLALTLDNGYHDAQRALEILEQQGLVQPVADARGTRSGYIAT
jgi:hypothetical protein